MRIATRTFYSSIQTYVQKTATAVNAALEESSSLKKINSLSDDPVGLVKVMELNTSLNQIEQMERNITMGDLWLTSQESALTQVEDILTEAKSLCVQMANATQSADERANAATQVDGYLRQIVSLANTKVNGSYIFAGTNTDTEPFTFDDEDTPTAVNYGGNAKPFAIQFGKGLEVTVGCNGEEIFGAAGSSIFSTLLSLETALENDDIDTIDDTMALLDDHLNDIRAEISETGAKQSHLEIRSYILQDLELNYSEARSEFEDVDLAEVSIKLESAELAYQAALSSGSNVLSLIGSLANYI